MRAFRLFVSSPGDADVERRRTQSVVSRLNGEFAGLARLETIRWETEYYQAHTTFQTQIPASTECDLVVGILKWRLGTALPPDFERLSDGETYPSGTAYELLTAIAKRKEGAELPDVFVFRYNGGAPNPRLDDPNRARIEDEWARLRSFFERWFVSKEGHFLAALNSYESEDVFETQLETLLRKWLSEKVAGGKIVSWPATKGSPFRGLSVFGTKHAPVFFGRSADIRKASDLWRDSTSRGRRFLLIVGASGAGKSSLARAGLIPRITTPGVVPEVDFWRVAVMRPGDSKNGPVAALATALMENKNALPEEEKGRGSALPEINEGDSKTPAELASVLSHGDVSAINPIVNALARVGERARDKDNYARPARCDLVLLVDQLDELLAPSVPMETRNSFATLLKALIASGRVWVLTTLRADLYQSMLEVPALKSLKDQGASYDLAPPGIAELTEIVREPAKAADLTFETNTETSERLDERLLKDADRPDMLPLVQLALSRLWETRVTQETSTILTHAAFDTLGGVKGIIQEAGERALARVGEAERSCLAPLIRKLAELSPGRGAVSTYTSRSVPLSEAVPSSTARALVDALVEARLLTHTGTGAETTIRLSHQRVLSDWPKAAEIVAASATFYRVRDDVESQRRRWEAGKRRRELLLPRGLPLAEARDMARTYSTELPRETHSYINASRRRANVLQTAALAAAIVFAVVAAGAGTLAKVAADRRVEADRERQIAYQQTEEAKAQRSEAVRQEAEAVRNRDIAQAQTAEAESQRAAALAQKAIADEQKSLAESSRHEALIKERLATDQRDQALLSQSSYLANLSKQKLAENLGTDAALLALEALPDKLSENQRPFLPEAQSALFRALRSKLESRFDTSHQKKIFSIFALQNDSAFITVSRDDLKIWDGELTRQSFSLKENKKNWHSPDDAIVAATLSKDESSIVISTLTGRIDVIDVASKRISHAFETKHRTLRSHDDSTDFGTDDPIQLSVKFGQFRNPIFHHGLILSPDSKIVAKTDEDEDGHCLRLYDVRTGKLLMDYAPKALAAFEDAISFSSDGKTLFWPFHGGAAIIDIATMSVKEKIELPISRYAFEIPAKVINVENMTNMSGFLQKNQVIASKFSDDNQTLHYVTRDGYLVSLGLLTMKEKRRVGFGKTLIKFADFSNRAAFFAAATIDGQCSLWSIGAQISSIDLPDCGTDLTSVKVGEEGRYAVVNSKSKGLTFFDTGPINHPFSSPQKLSIFTDSSSGWISAYAFGDKFALTGGDSGHLLLWPTTNPLDPITLFGSDRVIGDASNIQISTDGLRVLTTTGNDADLWDRRTGRSIATMRGHKSLIRTASFDPTGARVLTASYDNTIRVWSGLDGKLVDTFGEPSDNSAPSSKSYNTPFRPELGLMGAPASVGPTEVWAKDFYRYELALFSPDGKSILAADARGGALLWQLGGDHKSLVLDDVQGYISTYGSTKWITAGAFSIDGKQVVTGSYDGTLQLWSAVTGEPVARLERGTTEPRDTMLGNTVVTRIVFLTNNRILVGIGGGVGTGGEPNKLRSYEIAEDGKSVSRVDFGYDANGYPTGPTGPEGQHTGAVRDIALHPNGTMVATAGEDQFVRLWDVASRKHLGSFISDDSVNKIKFSSDGKQLFVGSGGGLVTVLNVPSLKVAWFIPNYDKVADFDTTEDGQYLAVIAGNGARIWRVFKNLDEIVEYAQENLTRCLGQLRRVDYGLDRTPPRWCHEKRKYPYRRIMVGLPLRPLTAEEKSRLNFNQDHGALVADVPVLTPAWWAGIRKDDVVVGVDGSDIANPSDIIKIVSSSQISKPIKFQLWRAGKLIAFDVTPAGEKLD